MHRRDLGVDRDKSQLLFYHLLHATEKWRERDISHKRLTTQLEKIRSLSVDDKLLAHINELEQRIKEVIQREKKILSTQHDEDIYNLALKSHLDEMEQKLLQYQKTHEKREVLLTQLESGYRSKINNRQRLTQLAGHLVALRDSFNKIKARRKVKDVKKLKRIGLALTRLSRQVLKKKA